MKVANRRHTLLEFVHANPGNANVETLCALLGVSEATVRRDLTALAEQGLVMRTYGGAAHIGAREPEQSLQERSGQHSTEKARMARAALAHIHDHDTLLLDGGTSTAALARLLSERRGLHVITNNLLALPALQELPEGRVTLLGGDLRSESLCTFGPAALAMLERLSADKVFVSADGVVAGRGLCEASAEQAYLKDKMLQQAAEVFVLADASKLGRDNQQHWTPVSGHWRLITSAEDEALVAPFMSTGLVEVQRV
ncbi:MULTISPECIES: DeoR/GlpR family DNA-binding transcription regulator [unclassified Pseudomonas]|uniref:DeoR/GlpR family DNA-binding transcription regulator n=1 Tax=unclassified Pseudomonas TaxID=196821 RepID=UPI000BD34B97|nr:MULTISPECIES: DeoR/GlpR family DNA-binding transcription regulator [unclassified Pseudomonas]PVZ15974.1 DeoR family transcriptional regulator [Pseudomonas sp. URIL14HWK12:I12]PVZ26170.1 DeoR family transcriptional regulator [Pseudomonas sp. URIL14HWK12:I10]PVZ36306.1 DeoR family transcriptional regulator [Pseudomonas sp. URIL14HWK12:I11]SNZ18365.1 transcriptional regulator, DeoR family [Pseudomonas sp. URIL14HWK12:I9]